LLTAILYCNAHSGIRIRNLLKKVKNTDKKTLWYSGKYLSRIIAEIKNREEGVDKSGII